jgi:ABC-type nitrate/sulfonate/bicarbonate transport system substrate-binding protein
MDHDRGVAITGRSRHASARQRMPRVMWRQFAVLVALMLIAVACGRGGATDVADDEASAERERDDTGREIIRFAFSPDPVWDYLRDTGVLAEWEEEHNLRIHTSESWDEFTYFAAGHGDIVSLGTYELPLLEQETGVKVVAFGQYNHLRGQFMRKAGDPYETLADVPRDATVCVLGATEITADSMIADQLYGIDFRVGAGDFENVVTQDLFVMPELVARGECTVAWTGADAAVSMLRAGDIEMMNNGRATWQLYQDICKCDHKGIMSNLFVATEEWYDAHPDQAAAFLELWDRGLQLWKDNKEEIVGLYPQHFAVETEEDTEWIVNYVEGPSDWFADTAYMDEAWIKEETKIYDYMIESGLMDAGTELPRFEAMAPPS